MALTNVTATVLGQDGVPFALGTYSVSLVNSSSVSIDSAPYNTQSKLVPVRQFSGTLDVNGSFNILLEQNATVTGSFWLFTVNNAGNSRPTITYLATIAGTTQSLTQQLSSLAASGLPLSGSPIKVSQGGTGNQSGIAFGGISTLPKWSLALGNVQSGVSNARVLFVGDSTTQGLGTSQQLTQPSLRAFPTKVAQMMNSSFTPTAVGLGNPYSSISVDTRWGVGTGWSLFGTIYGFGTRVFKGVAGTAGPLVYTSGIVADSYYVYVAGGTPSGTYTITATGSAPVVVTMTSLGPNGVYRILVTAASASAANTVSIVGTGQPTYVYGVEPFLSTVNQVLVGNVGQSGSTTSQWVIDPVTYGSVPSILTYAPDLTVISLGINDSSNKYPVDQYTANMQLLINAGLASGDVILMTMPPSNNDAISVYEPLYIEALYKLAKTNNLQVIDIYARFGGSYKAPFMFDTLHPNDMGYLDWARLIKANIFFQ